MYKIIYKKLKKDYFISNDPSQINMKFVLGIVLGENKKDPFMCYAKMRAFENSMCFSIFHKEEQIGFIRVITDTVNFAYICDVNIASDYQRQGIGKLAFKAVLRHPDLKYVGKWRLDTEDAHEFYKHFGFNSVDKPERCMEFINY